MHTVYGIQWAEQRGKAFFTLLLDDIKSNPCSMIMNFSKNKDSFMVVGPLTSHIYICCLASWLNSMYRNQLSGTDLGLPVPVCWLLRSVWYIFAQWDTIAWVGFNVLLAIFMLSIIYFNVCLQRMSLKAIASHLVEITYISTVFDKISGLHFGEYT